MESEVSGTAQSELLASLENLCGQAIFRFNSYLLRVREDIRPGGSVASDEARYIITQSGPRGAWEEDLADRICQRSLSYLTLCLQHIGALEVLMRHYPYGLHLGPIVRTVAEATGKCLWLLDSKLVLGEDTRRRVARLLLDEEEDARREKYVAYGFNTPDRAQAGDRWGRARKAVRDPGYFNAAEIVVDNKTGALTLAEETFPKPQDFVTRAQQMLHPDRRGAPYVYSYLSCMVHPSVFGLRESVQIVGDGEALAVVRQDTVFTAKLVTDALQQFCDGWRVFSSWTDQDLSEVQSLIDLLNSVSSRIHQLDAL